MYIKTQLSCKDGVHKVLHLHHKIHVYNTLFGNKFVNHEALSITKSTDVVCQIQAKPYIKIAQGDTDVYNMTV